MKEYSSSLKTCRSDRSYFPNSYADILDPSSARNSHSVRSNAATNL